MEALTPALDEGDRLWRSAFLRPAIEARVFWADGALRFCIEEKCLVELHYRRRDYNAFSLRDGICRGCPVALIRQWPRLITPWDFFRYRAHEMLHWRNDLSSSFTNNSLCQKVKLLIKEERPVWRTFRTRKWRAASSPAYLPIQRIHQGVKRYTVVSVKMTHCIYLCKYVTNDAWRNPINCLSPFVYLPMYINALVYSSELWFSHRDDG